MNKYPFVYLLRDTKFVDIDDFFEKNKKKLSCTLEIISLKDIKKLNNLFDTNHHILITYGDTEKIYYNTVMSNIAGRMRNRWLHMKSITDIANFNFRVNSCYINEVIKKRELTRPKFSVFTTCYKSYDKIKRAYSGLSKQTFLDWEWVILDDSPEDGHFFYIREFCKKDKRIRLYKRDYNSGNIGNVKNEAVGLCRGRYVLELDHDDIILPDLLRDAFNIFESDKEIGFVYADFTNIMENGGDYEYGDHFGKGYCGYYLQKYNNSWRYICSHPGINNITSSHLVCLPNHPRIWKRKTLLELGNYSEFLPICDDFEILLRTVCNTKIAKLHKLGYVQFMNNNNNNFSLIRNKEINRLGPFHIQPQFYKKYNVNEIMKTKNAYENEKYIYSGKTQIWKRKKDWTYNICNITVNPDFDKQYCLLGINILYNEKIKELYKNPKNDFMVLCNSELSKKKDLTQTLDKLGFDRMKCYSLKATDQELINYFHLICKYTDNYEIFSGNESTLKIVEIKDNFTETNNFPTRYSIINNSIDNHTSYLEIGVESGFTFQNVNIDNKKGVDPDPKCKDDRIIKKTSDDFFVDNKDKYDIIFIDGMHQSDYVLRDFNNSVDCLNENGYIYLDDVLPLNEREQHKIPIKHVYEKGILKYRESWTGDVWKFVYYLIKHKEKQINFKLFTHKNYRGVLKIKIKNKFEISPTIISDIEKYDYNTDFENYKNILMNKMDMSTKNTH